MSDQQQQPASQVPLVTFRSFGITEEGEHVVFAVADRQGGIHNMALNWRDLSAMAHMLNQAGVAAAQRRQALGNSDDFKGVGSAQVVARFSVSDVPERNLRVLSFVSPSGMRADFALSREQKDQNGRPLPEAIAVALMK